MIVDINEDLKEMQKYKKALQDLKDVSKGGKDYAACSFMDISVRIDRLKAAKKELTKALGKKVFKEIFPEVEEG